MSTNTYRYIAIVFVASGLTAAARAQEASPAPAAPAADAVPEATSLPTTQPTEAGPPFLWEVHGPRSTSYLFGTIHLGVSAGELPQVVTEALRSSPVAVFEADVRSVNPLAVMGAAMYSAGESLDQKMSAEQWTQLLGSLGASLPEAMVRQYRPWFLYTIILQSIMAPIEPMDMALMRAAEQNLSEVVFLETADLQIELLASVSEQTMLDQIHQWAEDPQAIQDEMEQLVTSYRQGDLQSVAALVQNPEDMASWPDLFETIMFQRNLSWVPSLVERIETGGAFVAVGLAHLIGDRSVIELLREQGYTVERVDGIAGGTE